MRLTLFLLLINANYFGIVTGTGHLQWWHALNVLAAVLCFAALWVGLGHCRSAA
jgi:hypothetical protein